jgi:hypothetical protein
MIGCLQEVPIINNPFIFVRHTDSKRHLIFNRYLSWVYLTRSQTMPFRAERPSRNKMFLLQSLQSLFTLTLHHSNYSGKRVIEIRVSDMVPSSREVASRYERKSTREELWLLYSSYRIVQLRKLLALDRWTSAKMIGWFLQDASSQVLFPSHLTSYILQLNIRITYCRQI